MSNRWDDIGNLFKNLHNTPSTPPKPSGNTSLGAAATPPPNHRHQHRADRDFRAHRAGVDTPETIRSGGRTLIWKVAPGGAKNNPLSRSSCGLCKLTRSRSLVGFIQSRFVLI